MSIFIADAAFDDDSTLALAKISTIVASIVAGLLGWFLLRESRSSDPVAQCRLESGRAPDR